MAMAVFVLVSLLVLMRYAGAWGVPYFTFTTDRGSPCTNNFTGYVCTPMTLSDVEFFADLDLPDDTTVITANYKSTHDYQLDAVLEIPAASSAAGLASLREGFGKCQPDHPATLDIRGLTGLCVMANDDAYTESGEPSSRLYTVSTAVRKDKVRLVSLYVRSR
jgi:hypothetical protein